MQLSHTRPVASAVFDDPNLVSAAGLVPLVKLAQLAGLSKLAQDRLTVPTDKGANAGVKVTSLVAGMAAGADSIDDMAVLRHGGMGRVFTRTYAPSTLGQFLRAFTFGHVRQLEAVASRVLLALAGLSPLLGGPVPGPVSGPVADGGGQQLAPFAFLDIDDTIIEVHGHQKQGAGFGYCGVRGLNALIATLSTSTNASVIIGQRLRKGACGSPRGAKRMVADALTSARRLLGPNHPILVRADSAFYGADIVHAARTGGADVSITVRLDSSVKKAIADIPAQAWTTITYPNPILDQGTGAWVSRAEVAEISYTAFSSKKKDKQVTGRLVVRRIPDANAERNQAAGQDTLFDVWRFHAFFTTTDHDVLDTVAADKTHRHHAIIEQVNADLKSSALAHLPSAKFTANAAWLVLAVIAFNLTPAAATLTGAPALAKATTATIRRTLIHVPARIASSARRLILHLPTTWPWEQAWTELFIRTSGPPPATART